MAVRRKAKKKATKKKATKRKAKRKVKDIAAQLNMNYVTVRSKIQRGRRKLKDIFTDCCVITQGGKGSILSYEERKCCDDGTENKKSSC